jgi:hypothetical protein
MRRAAKVDRNQPDIIRALRDIGASVEPIHAVGGGVPDLLVGFRGRTLLMEVKSEDGTLTDDQTRWHLSWRGQKAIVRNVDEALTIATSG